MAQPRPVAQTIGMAARQLPATSLTSVRCIDGGRSTDRAPIYPAPHSCKENGSMPLSAKKRRSSGPTPRLSGVAAFVSTEIALPRSALSDAPPTLGR